MIERRAITVWCDADRQQRLAKRASGSYPPSTRPFTSWLETGRRCLGISVATASNGRTAMATLRSASRGPRGGTRNVQRFTAATVFLLGSLLTSSAGVAQHQHGLPDRSPFIPSDVVDEWRANAESTLKLEKSGDLKLKVTTLLGDIRLKPGRYQLVHRIDGSDHLVELLEVTGDTSSAPVTVAGAGAVKCRLEPLKHPAKTTTVTTRREGDAARVTKVLIRGEDVGHAFGPPPQPHAHD